MIQPFLHLIGISVFVGVLYGIWRANARRWNRLAQKYRVDELPYCEAERRMQTLILVGGAIGFNSYKGIVTVGATSEGVTLRLFALFSYFHPPLLIPYADLHAQPTRWYLNAASFKYTLAQVDDVEIIVDDELKDWIEAQSTGASHVVADAMVGGN